MLVKAVFEINGKEIELTEDGALQLRDDINRIFCPNQTKIATARTWPKYPVYDGNVCISAGVPGE